MSILDIILRVAVAATHSPGKPRPRTITITQDGLRRELGFYEVVRIAASVVGEEVPPLRKFTAICRLLRRADATVRRIRREQQAAMTEFTSVGGLKVLDLRQESCELVGLGYQHWLNLRDPKLGTKTQQTGAVLSQIFRDGKFDMIIVDTRKEAAVVGYYLARRGLTGLPLVAHKHPTVADAYVGAADGVWSEETVAHG